MPIIPDIADASRADRATSAGASLGAPALTLEKLTVKADRVVCRVRVNSGAPRMTTLALAKKISAAYPTLPQHSCVNERGETFAAVLECTSLPHVLEHMVIDEQVRAEAASLSCRSESSADVAKACSAVIYTGTTRWLDETAGVAEVAVSFADDLVALRSFQTAAKMLNALVVS